MKNVFYMALEPVETRYTAQWLEVIPRELAKRDVRVVTLLGDTKEASKATEGAFLNFTATNVWKNEQTNKLANLISEGTVKNGDHIFWPDAWHPGILEARYMIDLLELDVKMSGFWHAGSYDPQDFLGRKIKNKRWSFNAERAYYYALDKNFFATKFHAAMMTANLGIDDSTSIVLTGQPHYKLIEDLYVGKKRDLILFPHRISVEKQPEIFRDLAKALPEYEFCVCQEVAANKKEYHDLLASAKIVFSANLQETLGISAMEGVLSGAIPMLPDRLSYSEMYPDCFLYPSEWTLDFESYLKYKDYIISRIKNIMINYEEYSSEPYFNLTKSRLEDMYLTSEPMFSAICG